MWQASGGAPTRVCITMATDPVRDIPSASSRAALWLWLGWSFCRRLMFNISSYMFSCTLWIISFISMYWSLWMINEERCNCLCKQLQLKIAVNWSEQLYKLCLSIRDFRVSTYFTHRGFTVDVRERINETRTLIFFVSFLIGLYSAHKEARDLCQCNVIFIFSLMTNKIGLRQFWLHYYGNK